MPELETKEFAEQSQFAGWADERKAI